MNSRIRTDRILSVLRISEIHYLPAESSSHWSIKTKKDFLFGSKKILTKLSLLIVAILFSTFYNAQSSKLMMHQKSDWTGNQENKKQCSYYLKYVDTASIHLYLLYLLLQYWHFHYDDCVLTNILDLFQLILTNYAANHTILHMIQHFRKIVTFEVNKNIVCITFSTNVVNPKIN